MISAIHMYLHALCCMYGSSRSSMHAFHASQERRLALHHHVEEK